MLPTRPEDSNIDIDVAGGALDDDDDSDASKTVEMNPALKRALLRLEEDDEVTAVYERTNEVDRLLALTDASAAAARSGD